MWFSISCTGTWQKQKQTTPNSDRAMRQNEQIEKSIESHVDYHILGRFSRSFNLRSFNVFLAIFRCCCCCCSFYFKLNKILFRLINLLLFDSTHSSSRRKVPHAHTHTWARDVYEMRRKEAHDTNQAHFFWKKFQIVKNLHHECSAQGEQVSSKSAK